MKVKTSILIKITLVIILISGIDLKRSKHLRTCNKKQKVRKLKFEDFETMLNKLNFLFGDLKSYLATRRKDEILEVIEKANLLVKNEKMDVDLYKKMVKYYNYLYNSLGPDR